MLMKMSQYKSVMFTVSICLSSILLAILVAYACDSLKEAMDDAARAYHDAQQALIDYESEWLAESGGGLAGFAWYVRKVAELQADVDEKSAAYEAARGDYEACESPPERYTYTDHNGHVYEFSDKESYNRFLSNRGLSTI